jgi:hypothetical protein
LRRLMPRGCELDVDLVEAENTYATKKVILEVELEVGVLLDGLEDLGISLALVKNNHTAWYIP